MPPRSRCRRRRGGAFDEHGTPERVLCADGAAPLPERLAHGEVLVRMLAAPVGEDDLNRVATPLAVLNDFPPFNHRKQVGADGAAGDGRRRGRRHRDCDGEERLPSTARSR